MPSFCPASGVATDCVPLPPPNGIASAHTRILGANFGSCHTSNHTGTVNPTQLIGINAAFWMFSLQGTNYVDFSCFDFSQPDQCTKAGSGILPSSQVCSQGINNYADHGLMLTYQTSQGPSNVTVSDLSIHGLSDEAVTGGPL